MFSKSSSGNVDIVLKASSNSETLSYQRLALLHWYNPKTLFIPRLNGIDSSSFRTALIEFAMFTISREIIRFEFSSSSFIS